jgi:hypothetical protein
MFFNAKFRKGKRKGAQSFARGILLIPNKNEAFK